MKILQLTTHLDYGGIATYVVSLSKMLKEMGHEVMVISGGGPMFHALLESEIPHLKLNLRTKSEVSPKVAAALFSLKKIIRQFQPDVIHAHTRVTQLLAHFVSKRNKTPYISTCHGFFKPHGLRRRFGFWGEKTIAISENVKEHLVSDFGLAEDRVRVVYNGVDLSRFKSTWTPKEKKEFKIGLGFDGCKVVGIVARLSCVKGHAYLLQALKRLLPGRNDIRLLIVGDGPQKDAITREVNKLGLKDRVMFFGATYEVEKPLSAMDVFVLPTLQEGLGLSLLEAMAAGVPVVASGVGGVREIIEDGISGIFVPPRDPESLADAIDFLLSHDARARVIADNARAFVFEKFGMEEMARKIASVYKEISNIKNQMRKFNNEVQHLG